ncbi:MAG: hypothetical protein DDT19_01454 [Syntrophomonadaceae bacterium]|nr:hypothetical protein [Bacillota bacterium]
MNVPILTFSVKISILKAWSGFVERNYLASLPKGPNYGIRPHPGNPNRTAN